MAYFLITETLLMVDSRVKNMMIATWGKSEKFDEYDKVIDLVNDKLDNNNIEYCLNKIEF